MTVSYGNKLGHVIAIVEEWGFPFPSRHSMTNWQILVCPQSQMYTIFVGRFVNPFRPFLPVFTWRGWRVAFGQWLRWQVKCARGKATGSSRVTFNEAADPGNRQTIQVAPQTPKIILKEWTIGGSWKGLSLRVWGAEQVLVFSGVGWRGLGRASQIL